MNQNSILINVFAKMLPNTPKPHSLYLFWPRNLMISICFPEFSVHCTLAHHTRSPLKMLSRTGNCTSGLYPTPLPTSHLLNETKVVFFLKKRIKKTFFTDSIWHVTKLNINNYRNLWYLPCGQCIITVPGP